MALTKVKLIADGTIVQSHLNASHGITTADIGEGSNLYYTDARARAAVSVSGNALSYNSSTGVITSNYEESPTFTGNVGIGTSSPSQKLHVQNGYLLVDTNSAVGSGIWMPDINGNPSLRIVTDQATGSYTSIVNAWGNSSNTGVMLGTIRNDGIAFQVRSGVTLTSGFANDDGSTRFIVKGNGNVGIGTTSPTTGKLVINGDNYSISNSGQSLGGLDLRTNSNPGTGGYSAGISFGSTFSGRAAISGVQSNTSSDGDRQGLAFFTHASGTGSADSAEAMRLTSDGNLGIGETSPLGKLHVKATDTASTANSVGNLLVLEDSENGMSILSSTSGAGYILFGDSGDNDIGGILYDHSANAMRFRTNGVWDRMRIDSSGNVGIGTSSPAEKLTIDGTVSGAYVRISNAASGDVSSGYMIYNGSNLDFNVYTNPTFGNTTLLTREALAIRAGGSERMRITSSGNVGIGTTSPVVKLNVVGSAYFSGNDAWNGGGSEGNKTDIALIIDEGDTIYTRDSNQYLRTLIKKDTGDNIQIGEAGTSLIDNINFFSGSSCSYTWYNNSSAAMKLTSTGLGIGTTSPDTKLDVHGTTGTKNTTTLNSQTSSVYETSVYFVAGSNATSNHYITTTSVFPPMASGGYILVEVAASGYGSAGSNGFVFKYIAGGYGGHYNIPASYHPTEIIADTHTGNCNVAIYYPNSTTIGITVTNNQATYPISGVMRVKITTTYS